MRRVLLAAIVGCMALGTAVHAQPGGGTNNQPVMAPPPPMPPGGGGMSGDGTGAPAKPMHPHARHHHHRRRHRAHHAMMRGDATPAPASSGAMGAAPPT